METQQEVAMSDKPLPFDDLLSKQEQNPDLAIGPNGQVLDERLLPRGKSKFRNDKFTKELLASDGDELDAAVKRERLQKKRSQEQSASFTWLQDDARKNFEELNDLGCSNDEMLRSFPKLKGSTVELAAARRYCGISKDRVKKARDLRAVRELEKAKKDSLEGNPSTPTLQPVTVRLTDGRVVHPDGSQVSTAKLDVVQSKKRLTFVAALRDTINYEDCCNLWTALKEKAIIDREPWAIIEMMNRLYGKVDKGILGHAVESEMAERLDLGELDATQLRALADIAARMAGTPQSDLNKPDFIEEESAPLPRTSNHQLPPPT